MTGGMAVAKESKEKPRFSIEELAERHGVPDWAMAGLKVRMGWATGKQVEESEFRAALESFLRGPLAGGEG